MDTYSTVNDFMGYMFQRPTLSNLKQTAKDCYLTHKNPKWAVGNKIRILHMSGFPNYSGRVGRIHYQNNLGQLIGSWGQMAIIPEQDKFEIVP